LPLRIASNHGPVGTTFCVTAEPSRVFAFDAASGARLR
jgi:hypothetical protein